jgi:CHAT domain-containing protein
VRAAGERGYDLGALRFARSEVSAITRLYPTRSVAYVGAEASERRAKSLPPDVRYLHFACHGLLDEWLPLNSALALSATDEAGGDNGLLQAWEIFESVRLHADLVTLSACQTALGKETEGEGLVGLTRAFQYAGARSVLASLWSVSDRSTARLMERFYSHLKAGLRKDEALRRAQLDLIRAKPGSDGAGETRGIGGLSATIGAKPDATHPFHWAGFELFGDWR